MKKLLILLFSIFFLTSPSVFADDISDFTIEGISIGDSLLDYMTEDEILEEIEINKNMYLHFKDPNKYAEVYLWEDLHSYDRISFFIKNNSTNQYVGNKNEKYTILSIFGSIFYIENFDSCLQKRNEIAEVLTKMFPNMQDRKYNKPHSADPSGNSIVDGFYFNFDSGDYAGVYCSNFDETYRVKNEQTEGLNVTIQSKEINNWMLGL